VTDLAAMTWEEVRSLDRSRSVAILPVGAVEAHGPHLPLNTDVLIAHAMADAGRKRLAARGQSAVLLPALAYTAARFAAGFPGTVSVEPESVTRLIVDIARSLAQQSFSLLAIANAHLDPAHLDALERAGAEIREASVLRFAFPNIASRSCAVRLTEEFRTGACHAGRFETSILLATAPELVRGQVSSALLPNPASISRAIRDGKRTFEEAGGPRAYFGDPAAATREEGEQTVEVLGAMLEESVMTALAGQDAGAPR
jgi:creatinine amidohydrolase